MLKVICLATGLLIFSTVSSAAQSLVERGSYLVNAVMACDGCHTQRGPNGFNMEKRFSGGSQIWDEPAYTVRGSNITLDRGTGIGAWNEVDIKRLMTDGLRPNGVPVAPQMPFAFYKILTERDVAAVAAYVRTVPAIPNEVVAPVYKQAMTATLIPGGEKRFTEEDLKDKVRRGFYLGTIAHCMECHARNPDGSPDFKNRWGKGGHEMSGPYGKITVPNITSHPVNGIGAWTDVEIKTALTRNIGRDGRTFKQPMARGALFSKMTDDDLDALVAWLRTLPPLE